MPDSLTNLASLLSEAISDAVNSIVWFFETIASQLDNREIATLILVITLIVFVLVAGRKGGIAKSLKDLVAAVFKLVLIVPALLLFAFSALIIGLAAFFGIWTSNILLDTILEVVFIGIPSIAIAAKARSVTSIFKQLVLPEISLGAFAAFYINIESFSLPVEIALQFLIIVLSCARPIAESRSNWKSSAKAINIMLALIGLGILVAVTYRLVNTWESIDWSIELQSLLMAVYYPILLLPFVVALGYYAAYDALSSRIRIKPSSIKFTGKCHLFSALFPHLRNITHFGLCEIMDYAGCHTWKEQSRYIKSYKKMIRKTAAEKNAKLQRMESGLGKVGFDQDGLWLDWANLERIKTALSNVSYVQKRNWDDCGAYASDMQSRLVDVFTPRGCSGGSFVSEDGCSYICWMSNGTGFTFGIGASSGEFPPKRYEGPKSPEIDPRNLLNDFVDEREKDDLPNWLANFYTDNTYR